jgi:FKBP-type peptidyl-prolyl cis-trans isomerase
LLRSEPRGIEERSFIICSEKLVMVRDRRLAVESLESRRVMAGVVAVASDAGVTATSHIRLLDAETGSQLAATTAPAFDAGFKGGVRLALGDVTGDGVAEVIAAPGPGHVGSVRVFQQFGTELRELTAYRTQPFGPSYRGGIELAAGDIDGDRRDDIVAAMSSGSGQVKVFFAAAAEAAPLDGPAAITIQPTVPRNYRGGSSVAVADVGTFTNGALSSGTAADGKVEVVVASGAGMTPRVLVYDVSNAASPRVADTIVPGAYKTQSGISVSAHRLNADAIDDIVVSTGRGGRSLTQVYDGTVAAADNARIAVFSALGDTARPNAPLFTVAVDTTGDGLADRFLQTQGDAGGAAGIAHVSLGGVRQGAVSSLVGPLRIAAARYREVTTSSGLKYRLLTQGTGEAGGVGKLNTVNYTGTLVNGTVFDSSRLPGRTPFVFRGNGRLTNATVIQGGSGYTSAPTVTFAAPPAGTGSRQATGVAVLGTGANAGRVVSITMTDEGAGYLFEPAITFSAAPAGGTTAAARVNVDRVIEGWNEIIGLMRVGTRLRVEIPPALGYGNESQSNIPANSTLIFDMELLAVQ